MIVQDTSRVVLFNMLRGLVFVPDDFLEELIVIAAEEYGSTETPNDVVGRRSDLENADWKPSVGQGIVNSAYVQASIIEPRALTWH